MRFSPNRLHYEYSKEKSESDILDGLLSTFILPFILLNSDFTSNYEMQLSIEAFLSCSDLIHFLSSKVRNINIEIQQNRSKMQSRMLNVFRITQAFSLKNKNNNNLKFGNEGKTSLYCKKHITNRQTFRMEYFHILCKSNKLLGGGEYCSASWQKC